MAEYKVGIDFGTSNSGVAFYQDGKVHFLPIDRKNVVPEVVKTILYITNDQTVSIGQEAIETYYRHNINRQRRFEKRWVGEIDVRGADMYFVRDVYVLVDVLKPGRLLQFIKTGLRSDGYEGTMIFERYYTLEEIISVYLRELKKRAENLLNGRISAVTLGRPVRFFDDFVKDQRSQEILSRAAYAAGFERVEFEFEPVAAAYFYELRLNQPRNVLIFDFGGGTLDITIMRLGDPNDRHVFATGGIGIAGSDFDRAIIKKRMEAHFGKGSPGVDAEINRLIDAIADWQVLPEISTPQVKHSLEKAIRAGNASSRLRALQSLIFNDLAFLFYNRVEEAKIRLSQAGATTLEMSEGDLNVWELYTRHQFEHDIADFHRKIEERLDETIAASGLQINEIEAVVKTGGSSSIPVFTRMLHKKFGAAKVAASNTFSSVTGGLAIKAASM